MSIGKKILSAFMEVGEEKSNASSPNGDVEPNSGYAAPAADGGLSGGGSGGRGAAGGSAQGDRRFSEYFDNLFKEANIPGPDYYEFARMITAMQTIPDERARYAAAFAGLQVQGLDKEKLVTTAAEYLRVLAADADHFGSSVDAALQEKVHSRTAEAEEKSKRIQALSQEIQELQTQIGVMRSEIREAKSKLDANSHAYTAESERRKQQIQGDIEKINHYVR
jgi:hypothetical protein